MLFSTRMFDRNVLQNGCCEAVYKMWKYKTRFFREAILITLRIEKWNITPKEQSCKGWDLDEANIHRLSFFKYSCWNSPHILHIFHTLCRDEQGSIYVQEVAVSENVTWKEQQHVRSLRIRFMKRINYP